MKLDSWKLRQPWIIAPLLVGGEQFGVHEYIVQNSQLRPGHEGILFQTQLQYNVSNIPFLRFRQSQNSELMSHKKIK